MDDVIPDAVRLGEGTDRGLRSCFLGRITMLQLLVPTEVPRRNASTQYDLHFEPKTAPLSLVRFAIALQRS